jgi:sulfite reductase (NADPH) hemoprotein beta-component
MYKYDDYDHAIVQARVAQFRDQTERYLAGRTERRRVPPAAPAKRPLHPAPRPDAAPGRALRPALRAQLRKLRRRRPPLRPRLRPLHHAPQPATQLGQAAEVPDILAELAEDELHAIQTSGNCIRNVTTDHFAGVAADEIADPRPWAEILRQWSSFHPEFAYLPRKFKVAISGATEDRAAIQVHDLGLQVVQGTIPARSASRFMPAAASAAPRCWARWCASSCPGSTC